MIISRRTGQILPGGVGGCVRARWDVNRAGAPIFDYGSRACSSPPVGASHGAAR